MHNYHLVVDHPFVVSFIKDVTDIGQLSNNTFLVRGVQYENSIIQQGDNIEWVGNDFVKLAERLNRQLKPNDKLLLHWYNLPLAEFVMNLLPSVSVYNFHWGGELLEEPYMHHAKRNYAPQTLALIQDETNNKIKQVLKERKFPYFPFFWLYKIRDAVQLHKAFELKQKSVQRLQYNILHPANTGDQRLAQTLYSHPNLIQLSGFYDLNFDLAVSNLTLTKHINKGPWNILLNNAAHYSGNHLDAIKVLAKKIKINQYRFYCPLSYGGSPYQIQSIMASGKEMLKDIFLPITYLMPREEYVEFLNSMDILFMYQNISQGFGNIIAALTQGKPVFLRKVNSLTEMLTNIGIKVYDADLITDELILLSIEEARINAEKNLILLKNNFSKETRLKFLGNLLNGNN